MNKQLLLKLNNIQQKAVTTTKGAVLVLAGAGTGKTKVLTSRIAYIVMSQLCDINEILAVTFTNKASKEMKERAISSLANISSCTNLNTLWIGTFHSLCLRMIKPYYNDFDRIENFTIIDAEDQKRLIKKIMKNQNIDDKKYSAKSIAIYINSWKDKLQSNENVKSLIKTFPEIMAQKIYIKYEMLLKSLNAIDFGDILLYCVKILKNNDDALQYYQNKFKYIMVDEYQDTNVAQYVWLKLLAMQHKNICCVGDDDQSIYSWRGADIGNILNFPKDFENTKIIRLEQNYRSTKNILQIANAVISHNKKRMVKKLWTDNDIGAPVFIKSLYDPYEEANFISSIIERKKNLGTKYCDIAILVRTAFQTRAFEERFVCMGIPYEIIGGMKFYERKEVKDAIAYLKLFANPDDGVAFERIVNVPKRGVGIATIAKFYDIAMKNNISLPKAAESLNLTKLEGFFTMMQNCRIKFQSSPPPEIMNLLLENFGYIKMLKEKNTLEDEGRLEVLQELIISLHDFNNIQEFLDYISLVLDKNIFTIENDFVTISTIHAAKGLEYKITAIPGFEENIFPHKKAIEDCGEKGIEEERRLLYVALTRAKNEIYITMCKRRNFIDQIWQNVSPSRFLKNFPQENLKII